MADGEGEYDRRHGQAAWLRGVGRQCHGRELVDPAGRMLGGDPSQDVGQPDNHTRNRIIATRIALAAQLWETLLVILHPIRSLRCGRQPASPDRMILTHANYPSVKKAQPSNITRQKGGCDANKIYCGDNNNLILLLSPSLRGGRQDACPRPAARRLAATSRTSSRLLPWSIPRRTKLDGGKLTLSGVRPNSIVFADRPSQGGWPCTHLRVHQTVGRGCRQLRQRPTQRNHFCFQRRWQRDRRRGGRVAGAQA